MVPHLSLKVPGVDGKKHKNSTMRKLESNFTTHIIYKTRDLSKYLRESEQNFLEDHEEGWLKEYTFAWHIIKT